MSKRDIEIFCSEPTLKNFKFLEKGVQDFFYKQSKKCLDKNIGNLKLAQRVDLLYKARNLSMKKISSLKAIFVGMQLLTTSEFKKIMKNGFPRLLIYLEDRSGFSFSISYAREFKNLFFIRQGDDDLGIDKELNMRYLHCKQYFAEIFVDHPKLKVEKIVVEFTSGNNKILFIKNQGVVWAENYSDLDSLTKGKKECAVCSLLNKKEEKKCIACGSPDFVLTVRRFYY